MEFNLFIPGKNWRLSLAELSSLLETRGLKFVVCSFSKEFFVVSTEEKVANSIIDDLGGTIKIGVSVANLSTNVVRRAFLQKDKKAQGRIRREIEASGLVEEMVKAKTEKFLFGVSVYCADKPLRAISKAIQRFIGSSIKLELAGYGKKSRFMGFAKGRRLPQLSHIEVLKKIDLRVMNPIIMNNRFKKAITSQIKINKIPPKAKIRKPHFKSFNRVN